MLIRWIGLAALLGVMVAAGGSRAADKPSADDVKKAQAVVEKKLADLKAEGGAVSVLADEPLVKTFPGQLFISVRFRQYPVARILPEGFNASNLFVVKDGKAEAVKDGLEKLFKTAAPVKDDAAAKEVVRAYLVLAQELKNDGFYKFKTMDDAIKVVTAKNDKTATGSAVATAGGNGEITVTLDFDETGKLTKAAETSKLKPGPRPICQATKLLDADALVRRMAEQDLMCMGRAAKDYLAEQRAKANPELQKAIDRMWQRILDDDK